MCLRSLLGGEDRAPDEFRDLGDYGVAEALKSVHPTGKPINHSPQIGLSGPFMCSDKGRELPCLPIELDFQSRRVSVGSGLVKSRGGLPAERIAKALVFEASIVGNNPKPVSFVIGANGGSWDAVPPCTVPERGQVSENSAEPCTKQAWGVLHDDNPRSKLANETGVLAPQARALAIDARASSSKADVLAREAPADGIDGNSSSGQSICGEGSHVIEADDLRPVFGEHGPRAGFNFAEGDGLEAAGALQAQREAADAREEVEDAQHPSGLVRFAAAEDRHHNKGEDEQSGPDFEDVGEEHGLGRLDG